jgi:hypothetical protein
MDWRQWARERPDWAREPAEEAFWRFVDQKWKDALNVAAAEPPAWGAGGAEEEGPLLKTLEGGRPVSLLRRAQRRYI